MDAATSLQQILLTVKQNEIAVLQLGCHQFLLQQLRACRRRARRRAANTRTRMLSMMQQLCLSHSVAIQSVLRFPLRQRLLGSHSRTHDWWTRVVPGLDDGEFRQHFRLSRATFSRLCTALEDDLRPADVRKPPTSHNVQKKVAITLFRLVSCFDYAVVGEVFGVSKSTVCSCMHDVVQAVIRRLLLKYVHFPDEGEVADVSAGFEKRTSLPQVAGVIGSMYVPVVAPTASYREFVNSEGWTSLVMQGVVDHKLWSVTCRNPGNDDDAVLAGPRLHYRTKQVLPQGCPGKEGVEVPYYIIGDGSYPLAPWLMKPYKEPAGEQQEWFNECVCSALRTVDEALTRLKARWRLLASRSDLQWNFLQRVVLACVVLHNIAELNGDGFDQEWVRTMGDGAASFPQPAPGHVGDEGDEAAHYIRDALCAYVARSCPRTDVVDSGELVSNGGHDATSTDDTIYSDVLLNNEEVAFDDNLIGEVIIPHETSRTGEGEK